jgi:flagellar hook-basal body complex protein FliE
MDGLSIKNNGLVNSGKVSGGFPTAPTLKPGMGKDAVGGTSFAETLKEAVNQVNELQQTADVKMQQLATGETTDIADVKISAEKADIALRLMTSVRNKMIDAYHEIMKMQV